MKKCLILTIGLILVMPFVLHAEEKGIEIELIVMEGADFNPDPTFDGNAEMGSNPTRPTDFHASIADRTLTVTSHNTNNTQLIVRNDTGWVVVDTCFVGNASHQFNASGVYTVEIYCCGMVLVGEFRIQEARPETIHASVFATTIDNRNKLWLNLSKDYVNVSIDIFNFSGVLLGNVAVATKLLSGEHMYDMDVSALPEGTMFVVIRSNNQVLSTVKIIRSE